MRWDEEQQTLDIYTASKRVFQRLSKRGYVFQEDRPFGWRAKGVPLKALSFRRLETLTSMSRAAKSRNPTWLHKKPTDGAA